MGNRPKNSAREAFDLNIADAQTLVELAKLLSNRRSRQMRVERREQDWPGPGHTLGRWDSLACIENDRVFVTFKPGHADWYDRLGGDGLRPLLRQALVAACAAIETFCADRVMERYGTAMRAKLAPPRLLELTLTVEDYICIQENFDRPALGLRQVIELEVRKRASPAPAQIGEFFGLVGKRNLMNRVDTHRGAPKGSSATALQRIVERRNIIAHTGDRKGRGRAAITISEVDKDLNCIVSIITALDALTLVPSNPPRMRNLKIS